MHQYPALRRSFSAVAAVTFMGAIVAFVALNRPGQERLTANQMAKDPWPMWGGTLSRNMVNLVEKNLLTEWNIEDKSNVLWVEKLGSKSYGGPVVADGKIFIGTNNEKPRDPKIKGDKGVIMCFDQATGKFLWQRTHDKLKAGIVMDWPYEGICSTVAVDGKKLYYISNRCELICCTTDGKDVWSLDMIKSLGVFPHNLSTSSPLIVGDLVFALTSNGVNENHIDIPAPDAPSFVAVHKNTGNVVWKDNAPSEKLYRLSKGVQGEALQNLIKALVDKGETIMHGQWSSPVYAEVKGKGQVIFPGGDGWLRSYEPTTGKEIWRFDCNPKASVYKLGGKGTRNDFISTPVVYDNKVYIGVGQDPEHDEAIGHFWCIDITKTGDVSTATEKDKGGIPREIFDAKDPRNKDSALVWHYGEPSPKEWKKGRNYVYGRTLSTPAIHDGLVYTAELAGYLHCLDAKTGEQYWTHNVKSPIWASPYWVDGKILQGNEGGEVHILAHGKKKDLLATIDMDAAVSATPVMADGVLYIMTANKLYAIGKKK